MVDGIERYKSADRKIFVVCTRDHKQWNTIQTPSMQIGFKFNEMRCARLGPESTTRGLWTKAA